MLAYRNDCRGSLFRVVPHLRANHISGNNHFYAAIQLAAFS